jgi:hypothetical protein
LLFQSSNIGEHKNAFDVLTPWPESTSFHEFGTIGLSRPQKKLKGAVFSGFPTPNAPTQQGFHLQCAPNATSPAKERRDT